MATLLDVPFVKFSEEYVYDGIIYEWVDGDTASINCIARVDYGFRVYTTQEFHIRVRLNGIDTPERGQVNYKEATAFAAGMSPVGSLVKVKTYKMPTGYGSEEKYDRYLADIYTADGANVNQALLASGLAVEYWGGTKPKPTTT